MQDIAPADRRDDCAPVDRIDVRLRLRHPSGMEVRSYLLRFSNTNRRRQQCVTPAPELLRSELRMRLEIYHLTPGVDAGICPACALQAQALLR